MLLGLRHSQPTRALVSALATLFLLATASSAQEAQLEAMIEVPDPGEVATSVEAEFILINNGDAPVSFLVWNTPLEGLFSEMGTISRDGEPLPYLGIEAKRGDPGEEDYVTLQPGEAQVASIDLSQAWDLSVPGSYQGRFEIVLLDVQAGEDAPLVASVFPFSTRSSPGIGRMAALDLYGRQGFRPLPLVVPIFDFEIGPGSAIMAPVVGGVPATTTTYDTCSADEKTKTVAALDEARRIADASVTELGAQTEAAPGTHYPTWFGDASGRYDTVKGHFDKIALGLRDAMTLHCTPSDCKASWFAYVRPADKDHNIYLCPAYWKAGGTGTDSKAGTLVHEMSHFNDVADTDDIQYGQTSCKKLATDDPDKAIKNADSHEYFAEAQ